MSGYDKGDTFPILVNPKRPQDVSDDFGGIILAVVFPLVMFLISLNVVGDMFRALFGLNRRGRYRSRRYVRSGTRRRHMYTRGGGSVHSDYDDYDDYDDGDGGGDDDGDDGGDDD